jgi:hypothetical protein
MEFLGFFTLAAEDGLVIIRIRKPLGRTLGIESLDGRKTLCASDRRRIPVSAGLPWSHHIAEQ